MTHYYFDFSIFISSLLYNLQTSKDFTEPIDKVRDDSINDLMATIAKLDSNGVQVLPEGRTKTTSPQVHSSTDLSNTQEGMVPQYLFYIRL